LSIIGEADDIAVSCGPRRARASDPSSRAVIDEAMTNTIAMPGPPAATTSDAGDRRGGRHRVAVVSDDGIDFDPLEVRRPTSNRASKDRPVGGLGVHFMKTLMDEVVYRREGDRNVLTMRKSFAAA
jgi:serine/threonine-protein kinase RsbW